MKKSQLEQIIKEELQKEITVKPSLSLAVFSSEYKKFYQLVELCDYWGVEYNAGNSILFNPELNDYYFFCLIHNVAQKQNWTPNYCRLTTEDFEQMIEDYNLDESEIQQVKDKFQEHFR
jgi:hypothetical protein